MYRKTCSVSLIFLVLVSNSAVAGLLSVFKYEDGRTNWQYIANGGGGFLILLLTITAIVLLISRRKLRESNYALKQIRDQLEQRVAERTATLNDSNRLLQETNTLLETEIEKHKKTSEQLRSSESYIKNILESMPLTLIGLTKDGTITQWNKEAKITTGISPEDALGNNLWNTYHTIYVTAERIHEAIKNKETITYRHNDRGYGHYEVIIYPLTGPSDTEVIILIDDVTKQVKSENKLIQRDKMSSMGELAAAMAHDINIPLNTIVKDISHIQTHLDNAIQTGESLSQETREELNCLLLDSIEQGQLAAGVIENLIAFSGMQNSERQSTDITELMEHTLDLAAEMLSSPKGLTFKEIAIVRDFESNLPPVPCLGAELQQVFLSILRHAFHAMTNNGREDLVPTLKIQIMECYDYLWVRIQHNGTGLTLDEQQFIFEPYFGTDANNEDFDAGKRLSFPYFIITEHHEGHMAVTSDVEVGTTFHMQLPMK